MEVQESRRFDGISNSGDVEVGVDGMVSNKPGNWKFWMRDKFEVFADLHIAMA